MFVGEDTHALDDKGRVVLPRKYRDDLAAGCVVAKGPDRQLHVYPRKAYEEKAAAMMSEPEDKLGRRRRRTFFTGADEQTLDKAGRLLLKQPLRAYAGLEDGGEVAVLGVGDRIELWNPTVYEEERIKDEEVFTSDEEVLAG